MRLKKANFVCVILPGSTSSLQRSAPLPLRRELSVCSSSALGFFVYAADDLFELTQCPKLSVLDLQNNRLDEEEILDVLSSMPSLAVLQLHGNPVVPKITSYRRVTQCSLFMMRLQPSNETPVAARLWWPASPAAGSAVPPSTECPHSDPSAWLAQPRARDQASSLHASAFGQRAGVSGAPSTKSCHAWSPYAAVDR